MLFEGKTAELDHNILHCFVQDLAGHNHGIRFMFYEVINHCCSGLWSSSRCTEYSFSVYNCLSVVITFFACTMSYDGGFALGQNDILVSDSSSQMRNKFAVCQPIAMGCVR